MADHSASVEPIPHGEHWSCACGQWSGIYSTTQSGLDAHWTHVLAASQREDAPTAVAPPGPVTGGSLTPGGEADG